MPDSPGTSRPLSPETQGGNERKRRRKVLSCYDCRRRKLQCDRVMPACGRCVKAGQASNCLYLDDSNETPTQDPDSGERLTADKGPLSGHITRPMPNAPSGGNVLGRLEFQDRRIKELEGALSSRDVNAVQRLKNSKYPLTPESATGAEQHVASTVNDREVMMLRGKSFKTHFLGATHVGSLIAYLPELNLFTKEAFSRFPALSRIRQNMKQLEDRRLYVGTKPTRARDDELRLLLRTKVETDELIDLYLDRFDNIFHIIHLPSFKKDYEELWRDLPKARTHFVAVVLLMASSARCLVPDQPWLYTANSSTARDKAVTTIQACDDWLLQQSQKHVTIEDFQIRLLLQIAKLVNARKFKRSWTEAGDCLRFFMSAGLHRNPDLLRKPTSILDKEMRRRLWAAMAEFELQTSFDRGMVSAPWPMQCDVPGPSNMHDEDLDQSSDVLPESHGSQVFTKSSYLAYANETLLLRHQLNTLLNNIRQSISFEDSKKWTEEVEQHLQNLPQWIGTSSEAPKALLSIGLRQYLLALHDRQIRQLSSHSERNFSRMVILDSAAKMIDTHRAVLNEGDTSLELLCHDYLRAALSACHLYTTVDPQADRTIYRIVEEDAFRIMDEAIAMVNDKVVRYGREQRQQWIALAAHCYMKSKQNPSKRLDFMQEAVDKVTRPYYKILACQEDPPAGTLPPATNSNPRNADMPNGLLEYFPEVQGQPQIDDPPLLDLDAIASWTFEDWAFNPADVCSFTDADQV